MKSKRWNFFGFKTSGTPCLREARIEARRKTPVGLEGQAASGRRRRELPNASRICKAVPENY
jgi:hypothetical protein